MMSSVSSPGILGKRKRGRPRRKDEDKLSPSPARTNLSTFKRQKLSTNESSPSNNGTTSGVKRGAGFLGHLLGIKQLQKHPNSSPKTNGPKKSIWELDLSEDDNGNKKRNSISRKTFTKPEAESEVSSRRALKETRNTAADGMTLSQSDNSMFDKSESGSRKSDESSEAPDLDNTGEGEESTVETPSGKKIGRGFNATQSGKVSSDGFQTPTSSGALRLRDRLKNEEFRSKNIGTQLLRLGRSSKGMSSNERISDENISSIDFKGIMPAADGNPLRKLHKTWSKKNRKSKMQATVSDQQLGKLIAGELCGDILESISLRRAPGAKGKTSNNQPAEDQIDTACTICGELDSEPPNEMLLCDKCDFAAHQECCDVAEIPEGNWYCKDCQLENEISNQAGSEQEHTQLPINENAEKHLRAVQKVVLAKLTCQRRVGLQGHDQEMQKVHQMLEQTIVAGEGNSMLIIGSRGSGKTNLVETVISNLTGEHGDHFHVVRLNGFIQTDDKLASREIWRQLGREMELEEDTNAKVSSYADTLASLLALLSHPSDFVEGQTDQTAKSVIFVLDEFDLFATHPRQTLLYNLFDIAQARKAPIAVVGLTAKIDVVETLEKRVKSRFSHRYVHLSLPKSLPAFWDICKQYLIIDEEQLESSGSGNAGAGQGKFIELWNSMMIDLYEKDTVLKRQIQFQFYRSKSVVEFLAFCLLPIASLSPTNFPLTTRSFDTTISISSPDSKLHILQGLSELELALLISAARLDVILDTDTCNFSMAYEEYGAIASKHKIQTSSSLTGVAITGGSKVWSRDVALGAWEKLSEYELIIPSGQGGSVTTAGGLAGRMWKVDVALEEIAESVEELSGFMAKWCREI